MTPEQTVKYFIWYCHNVMDYDKMAQFLGSSHQSYIEQKWGVFRKSYTVWFMDLDPQKQSEFMEMAISHYNNQ